MDLKKIGIIAVIVIVIVAVFAFMYISMNTHNSRLDIIVNETSKNGDYLYVELKDDYRNVYAGEAVDIKILDDSGWAYKYNITTDELGRGYIQLLGFENGNYTVRATFNGTMFLTDTVSSTGFTIDDGYSSYY